MNELYIQETFINQTEGYRFSETPVYEAFTSDKGELYKSLVNEYGRCTSKIRIDTAEGTKTVGWVFVKRMQYEDCKDNSPESFYLRETWVTVHTALPEKRTTYHYADITSRELKRA